MEDAYRILFGEPPPTGFLAKGLQQVPKLAKVEVDFSNLTYNKRYEPSGEIPEEWQIDERIIKQKCKNCQIDGQYILHEAKGDKILESTIMGRKWTCDYPGKCQFLRGVNWGGKTLKIEPQFAGLTEEVMDRFTISALQSLPHLFPGSRQDQLLANGRAAMHTLTQVEYNPTRLLWRMAVLYTATLMMEAQGRAVSIDSVENRPEIGFMESLADLNRALVRSVATHEQHLYVEAPRIAHEANVLEIYQLLMSDKIRFSTNDQVQYPQILNLWPTIESTGVLVYGMERRDTNIGQISSGQVALAVDNYIQQYGLSKEFSEIMRSVATFAFRPKKDTIFNGHANVLISLPASQLEPSALGPMLATVRHWERGIQKTIFPELHDIAWQCFARYSMWSLCHRQVTAKMGAELALHVIADNRAVNAMEKMYSSQTDCNGVQQACENMMAGFGWENGLGRILQTVIGTTQVKLSGGCMASFATPLLSPSSIQWEEAMPYLKKMPADSYISSMMFPPLTEALIPAKNWVNAAYVKGSITIAEAMYALAIYANSKMGYAQQQIGDGSVRYRRCTKRLNYRGTLADNQFFVSKQQQADGYRAVAMINEPNNALEAFLKTRDAASHSWYIEDTIFFHSPEHGIDQDTKPTTGMAAPPIADALTMPDQQDDEEDQFIRLEMLQQEVASKKVRDEKPPEPETMEERLSKFGSTRAVKKPPPPDMFEVKAGVVAAILSFVPEWVDPVRQLRKYEKLDPISFASSAPGWAQNFLAALKGMDPREYPVLIEDKKDVPALFRNMATLIRMGVKYVPAGDSQLDVMRLATSLDLMATAAQTSEGAVCYDEYVNIRGLAVPDHVNQEIFDEALLTGLHVGEIVHSRDENHLRKLIDEQVQALDSQVRSNLMDEVEGYGVEAEEQFDAKPPEDLSDVTTPEGFRETADEQTIVEQQPITSTDPNTTVPLERSPPEISESDFGPVASLQGDGGADQPPGNGDVSDVEGNMPGSISIGFTASRETEQ
jgi:hypothetical protein